MTVSPGDDSPVEELATVVEIDPEKRIRQMGSDPLHSGFHVDEGFVLHCACQGPSGDRVGRVDRDQILTFGGVSAVGNRVDLQPPRCVVEPVHARSRGN